jgi:NiFe hydrogenase small subunit HydA
MTMHITRRQFLGHALSAGVLASLSSAGVFRVESWAQGNGPVVAWLGAAGCSGCFVSLANYHDATSDQGVAELFSSFDLRYAPLLMTASGEPAISRLTELTQLGSKEIILLVEGAIPSKRGYGSAGSYGEREFAFRDMLVALTRKAVAVVGVGSCAAYGGVAGTRENEPRFAPIEHYLPPTTGLVLVPGCPPHPDWVVETLVRLIAAEPVPLDRYKRPVNLFSQTVCSQCPRSAQRNAGRFARDANDPDFCLEFAGCRGAETFCDTPTRGWNGSASSCLTVNGICIGCTEPFFPDTPFVRFDPPTLKKRGDP